MMMMMMMMMMMEMERLSFNVAIQAIFMILMIDMLLIMILL